MNRGTKKVCPKCGERKDKGEFSIDSSRRDKLDCWCRECKKGLSKNHHTANREKDNTQAKIWYKRNKKKHNSRSRVYYEKHRKEISAYGRRYCKEHREQVNTRQRNRRAKNINVRIMGNLRARLWSAIKGKTKCGSAVRDLGCTIEQLKIHLEKQFKPGMTWSNYGKYDPTRRTWAIDHIKPFSLFKDLTRRGQITEVCNYTNLQPIWWDENAKKGSLYKGVRHYHKKGVQR